jgi:hypothetical protein
MVLKVLSNGKRSGFNRLVGLSLSYSRSADPILHERPKNTQRRVFLLFEYDNCWLIPLSTDLFSHCHWKTPLIIRFWQWLTISLTNPSIANILEIYKYGPCIPIWSILVQSSAVIFRSNSSTSCQTERLRKISICHKKKHITWRVK